MTDGAEFSVLGMFVSWLVMMTKDGNKKYKTSPPLQGKVFITFILAKAETSKQYISLQNVNPKLVSVSKSVA
jgi:hypothetical protein